MYCIICPETQFVFSVHCMLTSACLRSFLNERVCVATVVVECNVKDGIYIIWKLSIYSRYEIERLYGIYVKNHE